MTKNSKQAVREMKPVDMTDHGFSDYLFRADPNWQYESVTTTPPYTKYFTKNKKKILAIVIYDNARSTRRIYIP